MNIKSNRLLGIFKRGFAPLLVGSMSLLARAQDARRVCEPAFPPACTVLKAQIIAVDGKTIAVGDENRPDTARIQQALNDCPHGKAVELVTKGAQNSFLTGPLDLPGGVALRVGQGAILFGSRNPRDYDLRPGSCGVLSDTGHGCKPLISVSRAAHAAIMGPGTIDGRGWAALFGQPVSWWDLAQQAKVRNNHQNCPFLILATHSDDFTLYDVTLKNAGMFHVYYHAGNGFTAWGVTIETPKTARNTDGIDPSSATNVTITRCWISDGDDDVAIKAGRGGPSSRITVAHNHFYTGHGMSIGSETNGGVSAVRVEDLTIDGADNGLRIKSNYSRGGLVHDVIYSNICIRNTKNPILLDSNYSFYGKAKDEPPLFRGIVMRNVHISGSGRITLDGLDSSHRVGLLLDNVVLSPLAKFKIAATHARVTLGPGPVNFRPAGEDVSVNGNPGKAAPCSCDGKFLPFPQNH